MSILLSKEFDSVRKRKRYKLFNGPRRIIKKRKDRRGKDDNRVESTVVEEISFFSED